MGGGLWKGGEMSGGEFVAWLMSESTAIDVRDSGREESDSSSSDTGGSGASDCGGCREDGACRGEAMRAARMDGPRMREREPAADAGMAIAGVCEGDGEDEELDDDDGDEVAECDGVMASS